MSTISNTITHGVTLATSGVYTSPLTITATGYIDDIGAGNAVAGPSAQAWTVANDGRVVATANGSDGIYLANGGDVANTGLIQGIAGGVYVANAIGTVTNSGTIVETAAGGYGVRLAGGGDIDNTGTGLIQGKYGVMVFGVAGTVTNSATITGTNGDGVFALAGSVDNSGTGLIQGQVGVTIRGSGTVTNSATITGTNAAAVIVSGGGSIDNSGLIQSNLGAIFISGAAGTVTNSATVTGTNGDGVYLGFGGSVDNTGTGLIQGANGFGVYVGTGAGTVTNAGTITGDFDGVSLNAGGSINNTGTGLIQGNAGVYIHGNGTVSNSGTITETGTAVPTVGISDGGSVDNSGLIQGDYGVLILGGAGTVTNSGTLAGTSSYEILLRQGGRVDNSGAGLIQGQSGVYIGGVAGAVTNAGTIQLAGGMGVALENGGSAYNTGLIQGGDGVVARHGAGTVTNAGTIIATQNVYGIALAAGGTIVNTATGLIRSGYGVYIGGVDPAGGGTTLANAGTIVATNGNGADLHFGGVINNNTGTGVIQGSLKGVYISGRGGTVTNAGTIDGVGGIGVAISPGDASGVTLVDSGTIIGGSGRAVELDGANPLLVLEAGYKFVGNVVITGATRSLELYGAAGSAVSANFDNFLAPGFSFTDVLFGPGGNATLDVSNTGGTLGPTISGFNATSDIIDLTGIGADGTISAQTATEITVTGSLGSETLLLDPSDSTVFTTSSDGVSGTDLIACFCPGTLIETPDGKMAVEDLAVGDHVVTVSGRTRRICWIGHRRIDLSRHRSPKLAQPIRILAGAFADAVPRRDLLLSPDHAVAWDGTLIAAKSLVNGATVRRETGSRNVTYLHVELDAHDILLAEDLPAESYLDTGNRGMFENAAAPLQLHPDLTNDQGRREAESCLPLATDPAQVEPVWRMLAERAEQLGHNLPRQPVTTAAPDVVLLCGPRCVVPVTRIGERYVFVLPRLLGGLRLVSRHAVPSDLTPWVEDRRRLGVLIRRMVLKSGIDVVTVPVDHPALIQGWWAPECHDGSNACRWTDGEAVIPEACLGSLAGPVIVEIELTSLAAYPVADSADLAIESPTFSQGRRATGQDGALVQTAGSDIVRAIG